MTEIKSEPQLVHSHEDYRSLPVGALVTVRLGSEEMQMVYRGEMPDLLRGDTDGRVARFTMRTPELGEAAIGTVYANTQGLSYNSGVIVPSDNVESWSYVYTTDGSRELADPRPLDEMLRRVGL